MHHIRPAVILLWLPIFLADSVSVCTGGCGHVGTVSRTKGQDGQVADATAPFPSELSSGFHLDMSEPPRRFWEYLDGGAQEIVRLGFDHLLVACYKQPAKDLTVYVEVYTMRSSDAGRALMETWGLRTARASTLCGGAFVLGPMLYWQRGPTCVRLVASLEQGQDTGFLEALGRDLCPLLSAQ